MIRLFKSKADRATAKLIREQATKQKQRAQFVQIKAQEFYHAWVSCMDPEDITEPTLIRLSHMAVFAAATILERVEENSCPK